MTDPKPAETRAAAGRPKQAAATQTKTDKPAAAVSTKDNGHIAEPVPDQQNPAFEKLVTALTRSIGDLAKKTTDTTPDSDAAERTRVVFAYDFLGVVLGRRAPSVFQLKTVTVVRETGTLTFTGLAGATAAKIRSAGNITQSLQGLQEGVRVTIDEGPKAIPDGQRIDSIVTFTAIGGTPVAIGPCLGPVDGGIIF
ncbi:hypothetical protein AB0C24_11815 [Amycolatopsis japonica]|uniref:hypothetical protein n=1 Tax=Amycolatopsis japonica TaxID=208439 RepID=UPI0033F44018